MALEAIKRKLQGQIGGTFVRINPQKPSSKIYWRLKKVGENDVTVQRLDNTSVGVPRGQEKTIDIGTFALNYKLAPPGTTTDGN
jgi:hypothetical protein